MLKCDFCGEHAQIAEEGRGMTNSITICGKLINRIAAARRVVVITGAGMSAESGVPTFRGENGLWRRYRAEDLATPDAFQKDPRLVWEWYD